MSLLLNGSKTTVIAGTPMQCIEIYTGESYTLPLSFTDSQGDPIDCTVPNTWSLTTSAKFYTAADVTYSGDNTQIVLGDLTLDALQPDTGAGTYSANLVAAFTNAATGQGYLHIPNDLTGNINGDNTPVLVPPAQNTTINSVVIVVTLKIDRESQIDNSLTDVSREPIGMMVRFQ